MAFCSLVPFLAEDLLGDLTGMCPKILLYGCYVPIFFYSLVTLRQSKSSKATSIFFAVTTVQMAAATVGVGIRIASLVKGFHELLINPESAPLEQFYTDYVDRIKIYTGLQGTMSNVMYILADAIVAWRAWVLFPHCKSVRFILVVIVLANTTLWVYFTVQLLLFQRDFIIEPQKFAIINAATIILSFATNMLATLLIGFRTWKHHLAMKSVRGGIRRTVTGRILIILIETGLGLAVMQILLVALTMSDPKVDKWIVWAFNEATTMCAAMFPTLIFIVSRDSDTSVVESTIRFGNKTSFDVQGESLPTTMEPNSPAHFPSLKPQDTGSSRVDVASVGKNGPDSSLVLQV